MVMTALARPGRPRRTAGSAAFAQVTMRERWTLRRQGRLDGRLGIPEVAHAPDPIRTRMRDLLLSEYEQAAALAFREYTEATGPRWTNRESLLRRAEGLAHQLETARRDLAEAEGRRPAPEAEPVYRIGDLRRPPALVAARRRREFEREIGRLRSRVEQLEAAERDNGAQVADLGAQIAALHRDAAARVEALRTAFLERQAHYNEALIRRHPEPDVLLALLELGIPLSPQWTRNRAEQPRTAEESS